MLTTRSLLKKTLLFLTTLLIFTCTNPVSPDYEYIDGLIYIEGFLGTEEGTSYVTITESDIARYYRNIFVSGATVSFVNADSGQNIPLFEENFQYITPPSFKGAVGEKWYLKATLPNGNQYLSEIETINPSVPVKELSVRYDKQLEFVEDYKKYVPGHEVSITFDDPENQTNYYYWRFKTYDKARFCKICIQGVFRNNECMPGPYQDYFTYDCDTECWQIDYGNKVYIFSDEFSNGATTTALPVANVLLTRKTKILVEIQQFSLTPKAYKYYKTIKDLVDNNGGLNAPLPAALVGNMYNPNDTNEYVLGRFTASSASTKSIMIDRTMIEERPLINPITAMPEPPPSTFLYAPCEESRYRTPIQPEGWID